MYIDVHVMSAVLYIGVNKLKEVPYSSDSLTDSLRHFPKVKNGLASTFPIVTSISLHSSYIRHRAQPCGFSVIYRRSSVFLHGIASP